MNDQTLRRTYHLALIATFLALIALPLLGRLLPGTSAFAATENRRAAAFPEIQIGGTGWGWSLASFPQRFERYWNDSFAFRWQMIRLHSLVKLGLGVSPSPKAIVGQEGWLYYSAEQALDYYRAVKPFSERDLARWRADLDGRRAWLAERGIRYLVVVAPNKETIYPEHMPGNLRPVRDYTRLDQLVTDLRSHTSVEIVDLREPLRKARQWQRVYHLTDTHWNDAGAYIAYREILMRLGATLHDFPAAPKPGTFVRRGVSGGDLARVLALEDRFLEVSIDWVPEQPRMARESIAGAVTPDGRTALECMACGPARAIMNQDSFNTNLAPLLAEHFARLTLVDGQRLQRELIETERPVVVIQEFVERALMCADLRGC